MSTFDGRIREYPFIWIDKFKENNTAQYYFLSHAHSDHLDGLDPKFNFSKNIYCTEQTARLLPLIKNYKGEQPYSYLKDKLIPVRYNEAFKLSYKDEKGREKEVEVQFLPANHCIGSAMILIQKPGGGYPVLYTGDTRAEPDFYERAIRPIVKKIRIKNLYMDTTCCDERRDTFISKSMSFRLLIDFIRKSEDHQKFFFNCWTIGYEEIWVVIADTFGQKIHVTKDKYEMYCAADESYREYLTVDEAETRFHACSWADYCKVYDPITIAIHPSQTRDTQMRELEEKNLSNELFNRNNIPRDSCFHQHMMLPFSFHSSLTEIVAFSKFVNPLMLTPCVAHGKYAKFDNIRETLKSRGFDVTAVTHSSEISTTVTTATTTTSDSAGQMSRTATEPESWSTDESLIKSATLLSAKRKTQSNRPSPSFQRTHIAITSSSSSQDALLDTTNGEDAFLLPKKPTQEDLQKSKKKRNNSHLLSSTASFSSASTRKSCSAERKLKRDRRISMGRNSKRSKSTSRRSSPSGSTAKAAGERQQEQLQQQSEADNEASTLEKDEKPLEEAEEQAAAPTSLHYTLGSQFSIELSQPPNSPKEDENIIVLSSDDEDCAYANIKIHKNIWRQLQKIIVRREDRKEVFGAYYQPPSSG